MTPIYFFLSLLATARTNSDYLALALGSMLGPVFHVLTPGFDLLLGGVAGGTIAYVFGRHRRRELPRE